MNDSSNPTMGTALRRTVAVLCVLILIFFSIWLGTQDDWYREYLPENQIPAVDWESIFNGLGYELSEPSAHLEDDAFDSLNLYARSAALIDGDTGRVLYGKDYLTAYPMASTTKIMTCIVALEYGNLEDMVTVSSYAAGQPEVRLGIRSGERYRLKDLLYGTMLTSYNDCAVAIAEHIGGSVEGFASLMNQKARDLGCFSAWFITPNGLDAENEGGVHRITAADLARILAYGVNNEEFLRITQASSHSFSEEKGKRSFTVVNKNAFLSMMDGVLSGKTGYTNDAGYCYAGALEQNGKHLVSVVLASGWPPHKTYKWSDTRKLMNYGLTEFSFRTVGERDLVTEAVIPVEKGTKSGAVISFRWEEMKILAGDEEKITVMIRIPEKITAPAKAGAVIGSVCICLESYPVLYMPVILEEKIEAVSVEFCVEHIFAGFFDISDKV